MYTTSQLAARFNITDQTVKRYADEFRAYLSPTATPEKGSTRLFSDTDLAVYDLIVTMKADRKQFEQIHAALKSGQRGAVVDMDTVGLSVAQSTAQLRLIARIRDLETELAKEQALRRDAELGRAAAVGREKLLRELLAEAHARLYKSD